MAIRWRITELREKKGWTSYRLAKVAGLEPSTVYKLEKKGDLTEIDTVTLEKLAAALGHTADPFELLQHHAPKRR
jgi:transcriptional regulator with XRE-family HTH domain